MRVLDNNLLALAAAVLLMLSAARAWADEFDTLNFKIGRAHV